jgi:hypothetical protein
VSIREAASRVGIQVYHTGLGQDERARHRFSHLLRGLDTAWSFALNPHRESGTRWRDAPGTVWATPLEHRLAALAMNFAALSIPKGT